jgi:hypothetical protein
MVSVLVLHAGAVQPLGFFPTMSVSTCMLFSNTSLCCCSFKVDTNSCVYPCSPISCPLSTILRICLGNDSAECAGVNHVVLILYLSQSLSRRSIPTVAPKIPREISVGLAGTPVLVFSLILGQQSSLQRKLSGYPYQPLTASMSIPYEQRTRLGMLRYSWSVKLQVQSLYSRRIC